MAMHGPDRLVGIRNALTQGLDHVAVHFRHGIADRVGKIDRGRALGDHRFDYAAKKVHVGTAAVFRAELDVVGELARKADGLPGLLEHLIRRHAQLLFHMQSRRCDESVDTLPGRRRKRFYRTRNVAVVGA